MCLFHRLGFLSELKVEGYKFGIKITLKTFEIPFYKTLKNVECNMLKNK